MECFWWRVIRQSVCGSKEAETDLCSGMLLVWQMCRIVGSEPKGRFSIAMHCSVMYIWFYEAGKGTGGGVIRAVSAFDSFGGGQLRVRDHSTGEGIVRGRDRVDGWDVVSSLALAGGSRVRAKRVGESGEWAEAEVLLAAAGWEESAETPESAVEYRDGRIESTLEDGTCLRILLESGARECRGD